MAGKIKDFGEPYNNCYLPWLTKDYEEYKALLFNAFKINGLEYQAERRFKELIIENNYAGYKPDGTVGLAHQLDYKTDKYGVSKVLQFTYVNGTYERVINGAFKNYNNLNIGYRFQGLPADISYSQIIRKSIEIMSLCDTVIVQNLNAVKTAKILTVKDKNLILSIKHLVQQIQAGMPIIEVSPALADALKTIDTSVAFIAPQVGEFKRQIKDELLIRIGTMSANVNKKERVQATEVNAQVGQCEDYIYSLLDNLNRQFHSYKLSLKAELNNSLEELYIDNSIEEPTQVTDIENNLK